MSYKMSLFFPELPDCVPVSIEANSFEEAQTKIYIGNDTNVVLQDTCPKKAIFGMFDTVSTIYIETVHMTEQDLEDISRTTKSGKNKRIVKTAKFPDGVEMRITASKRWAEAALFEKDADKRSKPCRLSDPFKKWKGVWGLRICSTMYYTIVVAESSN